MTNHTCQLLVKLSSDENTAVRDKAARLGMALRELIVAAVMAYDEQPSLHARVEALAERVATLESQIPTNSTEVIRDAQQSRTP